MFLLVAACSQVPQEAYFNRGSPESLLDASSEVVNIALTGQDSVAELADWINQDQPSRAELVCLESDPVCKKARAVFDQFGVQVQYTAAADSSATLIYERVLARDCENRFIDNSINPYNLNYPTFGCSVAANMVQMVSDKRQFTSPALLDYHDGEKAVQAYGKYMNPPPSMMEDGGPLVKGSEGLGLK